MILYCDQEKCIHNDEGECYHTWSTGVQGVSIEKTYSCYNDNAFVCMDMEMEDEDEEDGY